MKNGSVVREFEKAFADYVGAKYAIALVNGTATLHTALVALGVKLGDRVATTPLTMSATSIAILQAGAVPHFLDVDPKTWTAAWPSIRRVDPTMRAVPVDLYGLRTPWSGPDVVVDSAQTLRQFRTSEHHTPAFTSYSFQASKILSLGEGGMLVTDSEDLATKAREFSSLGYRMKADQPRIDPNVLKAPEYERHHSLGWNYRMNDLTAKRGLFWFEQCYLSPLREIEKALAERRLAACYYRDAIKGCSWITPQYVPEGWTHDYWCYTIALESKELWKPFTEAVVRHGGEMPYGAWRLTYQEPAFRHLSPNHGTTSCDKCGHNGLIDRTGGGPWRCCRCNEVKRWAAACPIAEDLQPRLVQFQTNNLESAEKNAKAVKKAIAKIDKGRKPKRVFVPANIDDEPFWKFDTITEIPDTLDFGHGMPCS